MGITASDSGAATTDCESFYKELQLRELPSLLNRQGAYPPPPPPQYLNGLARFTRTMSGEVKKRNSGINRKTFTHSDYYMPPKVPLGHKNRVSNSLDPDQVQLNGGPDRGLKCNQQRTLGGS